MGTAGAGDVYLAVEDYDFSIADPTWEERLRDFPYGIYPLEASGLTSPEEIFLTVILSEPLANEYRFKLIASVIVIP